MQTDRTSQRRAVRGVAIALGLLVVALVTSEVLRSRAETASMQAHQARWNCWTREDRQIAACQANASRSEDACDAAVAACRAQGLDEQVAQADALASAWRSTSLALRIAVLVGTISGALRFGLVRRHRRPTSDAA